MTQTYEGIVSSPRSLTYYDLMSSHERDCARNPLPHKSWNTHRQQHNAQQQSHRLSQPSQRNAASGRDVIVTKMLQLLLQETQWPW